MLDLAEDIRPISYIKTHIAEMVKQVENKKNPIVITQNGEAKAVLLDVSSYQRIINSLNLLKVISIGENDITVGDVVKHEDVKYRIGKKLGKF